MNFSDRDHDRSPVSILVFTRMFHFIIRDPERGLDGSNKIIPLEIFLFNFSSSTRLLYSFNSSKYPSLFNPAREQCNSAA